MIPRTQVLLFFDLNRDKSIGTSNSVTLTGTHTRSTILVLVSKSRICTSSSVKGFLTFGSVGYQVSLLKCRPRVVDTKVEKMREAVLSEDRYRLRRA